MRFGKKRKEEAVYDNEDFFFEDIVEDSTEDATDTGSYEDEFEMEHYLDGFRQEREGDQVYESFTRIGKLLAVILVIVVLGIIIFLVSREQDTDTSVSGSMTESAETVENTGAIENTETEEVEYASDEGGENTDEEELDSDGTNYSTEGNAVSGGDVSGGVPMSEIWTPEEPYSGTADMEFEVVSEIVTSKDISYLRTAPDTHDVFNVVARLGNGNTASRTGINQETGWSRLDYEGQTVYAVSAYLTTDMDFVPAVDTQDPNRVQMQDGTLMVFVDCEDDITPKEYVNLRTEPSTAGGSGTVAAKIERNVVVHRTGLSPDGGWSRIEYEGQVLYVVSSYMTVTE